MKPIRSTTIGASWRSALPGMLALALAAGCGGGGGGAASGGSGNEVGTLVDHPDADGNSSKRFVVDPNSGGNEQHLALSGLFWGRLVDVYDESDTGERTLQHKDYVIGEDIDTDGFDYLLETNPVTQKTNLIIRHPVDGPTSAYDVAFARLDKNLVTIHEAGLSSSGVFTMVPRNAVIVVRFNDLLDHELIGADTVRMLVGNPPEIPFECRIIPDSNHGDVVVKGGQPRFFSTRVLIDTTVSQLESFESEETIGVNGIGLPASITANLPNVLLRIPTVEDASVGQNVVLRNLSGHKVATSGNGPVDFSSPTVDVWRASRSGGSTEVTGDPFNGFLRDQDQPRIVGRQPVFVVEPPVPDPLGDELDFVLPEVEFLSDFCAHTPEVGDVLRQSDVFAQVTEMPLPHEEGIVRNLKVRLLLGDPEEWVSSAAGSAEFLSPFDDVQNVGQQACFLQILPTPEGFPLEPTEGLATEATISVRFSEAMDPASMTAFDSLLLTRVPTPTAAHEYVVGRVVQSQDLQSFTFVPDLPLAHEALQEESYYLTLVEGDLGPTDLAGNELEVSLPQIRCTIDRNATPHRNGGRVMRFTATDEEPPIGDDESGPLPEWNGQHLINLDRQLIRPRPLVRSEAPADRTNPVPSTHTPFALGVQTPLSGLGSKLQTVWRYCDFGFSLTDQTNFNMDVEGMHWSPIGGSVIADHFPEFEIRLCHSLYLPDEVLDINLLPAYRNSGLKQTFSTNVLDPTNDPQKIVHQRHLGYTVSPADLTQTISGTLVMPFPLNRGIPLSEYTFYTWRDTALLARGGPTGGGADVGLVVNLLGGTPNLMPANQVETIGLPLLMEFRCYPDVEALGLNALDISLAINTSARPDFRAFSTGGVDQSNTVITIDPDTENLANGGFNPNSTPPGKETWGLDNTFYIGALDLVTRVSRTYSIWFRVVPDTITSPTFHPPVTEPRPDEQPNGTAVIVAFRGASAITDGHKALEDAGTLDGYGDWYSSPDTDRSITSANVGITFLHSDTSWHEDVAGLAGAAFYQMRVTFQANPETGIDPELSALGLTWEQ